MNRRLFTQLLIITFTSLQLSALAAPEIRNGGDNGGTTYVDGATAAGDTIVSYTDSAGTPNTAQAVSNLTSVALVLPIEKEIRDTTGKPLPNGSVLVKGMTIWYVLYVWNRTSTQALNDLRLSDVLPPGVSYAGVMDLYNGSLTGDPAASAVWTTAASWSGLPWTSLNAAVDSDAASLTGSTLTLGSPGNAGVNVSAGNVLAIRFKVQIN